MYLYTYEIRFKKKWQKKAKVRIMEKKHRNDQAAQQQRKKKLKHLAST